MQLKAFGVYIVDCTTITISVITKENFFTLLFAKDDASLEVLYSLLIQHYMGICILGKTYIATACHYTSISVTIN